MNRIGVAFGSRYIAACHVVGDGKAAKIGKSLTVEISSNEGEFFKAGAAAVTRWIKEEVPAPKHLHLSIPDHLGWIENIGVPRGKARRSDEALAFDVETHLPLSVEDLVVDFARGVKPGSGESTFAFALRRETLQSLLDSFSSFEIPSVDVNSLSFLRWSVRDGQNHAGRYLFSLKDSATVIAVREGIAVWRSIRLPVVDGAAFLRSQLEVTLPNGESEEPWRIGTESGADALVLPVGVTAPASGESGLLHAAAGATLKGEGHTPRCNLRRGDFVWSGAHRQTMRPLLGLFSAVAFCLLTLGALFYVQGEAYRGHCRDVDREEGEIFQSLFPGQEPPLEISLRLASESKRLHGVSSGGKEVPQSESLLKLLAATVGALPSEMKISVDDLVVSQSLVSLRAQVCSHDDAEAIARALKKALGWDVTPARSRSVGGGVVEFFLSARKKEASE